MNPEWTCPVRHVRQQLPSCFRGPFHLSVTSVVRTNKPFILIATPHKTWRIVLWKLFTSYTFDCAADVNVKFCRHRMDLYFLGSPFFLFPGECPSFYASQKLAVQHVSNLDLESSNRRDRDKMGPESCIHRWLPPIPSHWRTYDLLCNRVDGGRSFGGGHADGWIELSTRQDR